MVNITETSPENDAKKRLMFLTEEDFYFLSYNCLLLLAHLKSKSADEAFHDIRKLSYLIEFVSNSYLAKIISEKSENSYLSPRDKSELAKVYKKARDRLPMMNRLLHSMEKKGILSLVPNREKNTIDAFLVEQSLPKGFISAELFKSERNNLAGITKGRRIRTCSLNALLESIFRKNGVATWLD